MHAPYFAYWGKARPEKQNGPDYHLLAYHSLDVSAVGLTLLKHDKRLLHRLSQIAGLSEDVLLALIPFFLALHDLGKFSLTFQGQQPDLARKLKGYPGRGPADLRHDTLGFLLWQRVLCRWALERGCLPWIGENPDGWRRLWEPWMRAMTGHHGKPPQVRGKPVLADYFDSHDRNAAQIFLQEISALLPLPDLSLADFPEDEEAVFARLAWALAGLTVLADWLGSNQNFFPYHDEPMPLPTYWDIAQQQAEVAVCRSGILIPLPATLSPSDLFPEIANSLSPLQGHVSTCSLQTGPQLFILEDDTGSGKTEAAFILALRLMQAGKGEGIFMGLPTMATANAMFDRVEKSYQRMFKKEGERPTLVLAHSAHQLHRFGMETPPIEKRNVAEEENASAYCAAWLADNRKKSLLAGVGVGTVDQALIGILPARHQSLRLLGLTRTVLIVDEVHANDPYMHAELQRLMEFHASLGGSAVLLSATLPFGMRQDLVNAFARGLGKVPTCLEKTDYPLATQLGSESLREIPVPSRAERTRTIALRYLSDEEAVIQMLLECVEQGGCGCWIRNSVGDAISGYEKLQKHQDPGHLHLFHARFAMADRNRIEGEVIRYFGKNSQSKERTGRLLVATQVVEQSLDLDFDLLISDLAPVDALIQRTGRLWRHHRERPETFMQPIFMLHGPAWCKEVPPDWFNTYAPATAKVYPHHGQLWLTAGFCQEPTWMLPQDARRLIEGVFSNAAEERIPAGLLKASKKAIGEASAEASFGEANTLKLSDGYRVTAFQWEDDTITPTRLGEDTITVRLVIKGPQEYRPLYVDEKHPQLSWHLSEVRVRRALLAQSALDEETLAAVCAAMPDKGRYCVPILLRKASPTSEAWQGNGLDARAKPVTICYSTDLGLQIQK